MKLSIVVSACVTLTACGASDAAFVERSFGVVADVGGKESGGSEVDAGRAGTGGSEGPESDTLRTLGTSGTSGTGGSTEAAGNRSTSGEQSEAGQADSVVSLGEEPMGSADGRTGVPEGPVSGGGGVPTPTPAPVPNTPPGNVDESRNLPAQCKAMGGPGTRVHIVSSTARIVSPESTVVVAHVNGNRGRLMLTLGGQREPRKRGCRRRDRRRRHRLRWTWQSEREQRVDLECGFGSARERNALRRRCAPCSGRRAYRRMQRLDGDQGQRQGILVHLPLTCVRASTWLRSSMRMRS